MTGCQEDTATFRATFDDRSEADRATLGQLTKWAERMCQMDLATLKPRRSQGGQTMSLGLQPPQQTPLFYIANDERTPHVYIYSQSYATRGRQAFLSERLGGSREAEAALMRCDELVSPGKSLWTTEFNQPTLKALEDLLRIAAEASSTHHKERPRPTMRTPYNPVREEPVGQEHEPFEVDPNAIDRATARHGRLQNALARLAGEYGLKRIKPGVSDPDFDIAWKQGGKWHVVEVKTTTPENESRQLRLGLGQVLDYQFTLAAARYKNVVAVLAIENPPSDSHWIKLCNEHDVKLVWPPFAGLFE